MIEIHPRGRLDLDSVNGLRQQLAAAFLSGQNLVRVDLSDVTALDLAGFGLLHGADRHLAGRGGRLELLGASAYVSSSLRVNGLGHCLVDEKVKLRIVS